MNDRQRMLIEEFVSGEISREDLVVLTRLCKHDADFRRALVEELQFAKLVQMAVEREAVPGGKSEFVQRCTDEVVARLAGEPSPPTVTSVMSKALRRRRSVRRGRRAYRGRTVGVLAAAAMLLIAAAGYLFHLYRLETSTVTGAPDAEAVAEARSILSKGVESAREVRDLRRLVSYAALVARAEVLAPTPQAVRIGKAFLLEYLCIKGVYDRQLEEARWLVRTVGRPPMRVVSAGLLPFGGRDRFAAFRAAAAEWPSGDVAGGMRALERLALSDDPDVAACAATALLAFKMGRGRSRGGASFEPLEAVKTVQRVCKGRFPEVEGLLYFAVGYVSFHQRQWAREAEAIFRMIPAGTEAAAYYRDHLAAVVARAVEEEKRREPDFSGQAVSKKGRWSVKKGPYGWVLKHLSWAPAGKRDMIGISLNAPGVDAFEVRFLVKVLQDGRVKMGIGVAPVAYRGSSGFVRSGIGLVRRGQVYMMRGVFRQAGGGWWFTDVRGVTQDGDMYRFLGVPWKLSKVNLHVGRVKEVWFLVDGPVELMNIQVIAGKEGRR